MKFFGPKHTAESVADQLIEGLENGTITLDAPEEQQAELPVSEAPAPKGVGPLLALTSLVLGVAATAVATAALLLTTREPLPWVFLAVCFAACAICCGVAFRLGATAAGIPGVPKLPTRNTNQQPGGGS